MIDSDSNRFQGFKFLRTGSFAATQSWAATTSEGREFQFAADESSHRMVLVAARRALIPYDRRRTAGSEVQRTTDP